MATFAETRFVHTGGSTRMTKQQVTRRVKQIKAEATTRYTPIYGEIAEHITSVDVVALEIEIITGLLVQTNVEDLTLRVFSPGETASLGGDPQWVISYGDNGYGQFTDEIFPADMSAQAIAYRVDFLVNIVNRYTLALQAKRSRRMRSIVNKMVQRIEPHVYAA